VLVTTHYLDEAEHCDRIAVISAGRLAALGTNEELRGVFAGRTIVELRGASPVALMRALDALPEVETTSLFGTAVHAVLRSRAPADDVAARLRAAGHDVTSADVVEPSLEDVFLDLVERAGS
jgi:ABC-2 type transport system ATP-binding protein